MVQMVDELLVKNTDYLEGEKDYGIAMVPRNIIVGGGISKREHNGPTLTDWTPPITTQ